jgi:hypothetical protein
MACIGISSCKVSALLRYYEAMSGNSLLMFQDNLSIPSSRSRNPKREESMT